MGGRVTAVVSNAAAVSSGRALVSLPVRTAGTVGANGVGTALAGPKFGLTASGAVTCRVAAPASGATAGTERCIGAGVFVGSAA